MKIPQYILEAAQKGGWQPEEVPCRHVLMADEGGCPVEFHYPPHAEILLSSDFWEALGRENNWKENKSIYHSRSSPKSSYSGEIYLMGSPNWYVMRLLHLILSRASDEDIEAYWQSISNK